MLSQGRRYVPDGVSQHLADGPPLAEPRGRLDSVDGEDTACAVEFACHRARMTRGVLASLCLRDLYLKGDAGADKHNHTHQSHTETIQQ